MTTVLKWPSDRAIAWAVPPADVVSQLESGHDEPRLLSYLHELFLTDVHLGAAFHGRQLRLYGGHAPHQVC
jgi:hypothetical protein